MDRDEFIPVGSGFEDARAGDLMSSPVASVLATDSLAAAAVKMREADCGALPVVDEQHHPIGMITDRDAGKGEGRSVASMVGAISEPVV